MFQGQDRESIASVLAGKYQSVVHDKCINPFQPTRIWQIIMLYVVFSKDFHFIF